MNLQKHRLTDPNWVYRYVEEIGLKAYKSYERRVYIMLSEMLPGEVFDIEKNVRESNYDLFIKLACQFMIDWGINKKYSYNFNETYTKIEKK